MVSTLSFFVGLCSPYICTPALEIANHGIKQSQLLGQHPIKFENFSTPLSYSGNQGNTKQSCTGEVVFHASTDIVE